MEIETIIRNIYFSWLKTRSKIRKFLFPIQVFLYNGKLSMGDSIRFDHSVKYQGCGLLEIQDDVILGVRFAGSPCAPILLQPRESNSIIHIGSNTTIVNGSELISKQLISIGEKCMIGPGSKFIDSDFHGIEPNERLNEGKSGPIIIENNVWIGSEVMVLKGVTIGRDAVIGARCVVRKNVPPGSIVIGNPMEIVGSVYARDL